MLDNRTRHPLKWRLVEGPVTYDFTLHLRVRDHASMILEVAWDGLWTLSFGLSQFHGHDSWLVRESGPKEHTPKIEVLELDLTMCQCN